jgi:hypothetical protein
MAICDDHDLGSLAASTADRFGQHWRLCRYLCGETSYRPTLSGNDFCLPASHDLSGLASGEASLE